MSPEQPLAATDPPRSPHDGVGRGALWVLLGHVAAVLLAVLLNLGDAGTAALIAAFFVGVYQWAYVVPLLVFCYAKGWRQAAKGVWILAGVSLLPTAACFGVMTRMSFH